MHVHIALKEN